MKPEGYENIVSRTLRNLDFPVHPGLCGKCGKAVWRLQDNAGGRQSGSYAENPDGSAALFCDCMARGAKVFKMIIDCDAYERAEDHTQGVPKGDLPSREYYFGENR